MFVSTPTVFYSFSLGSCSSNDFFQSKVCLPQMFIKKTQSSLSKVSKVTPETLNLFSNQTMFVGQFEIPYSAISDHEVKMWTALFQTNKQKTFKTSTQWFFFQIPFHPLPPNGVHVRIALRFTSYEATAPSASFTAAMAWKACNTSPQGRVKIIHLHQGKTSRHWSIMIM